MSAAFVAGSEPRGQRARLAVALSLAVGMILGAACGGEEQESDSSQAQASGMGRFEGLPKVSSSVVREAEAMIEQGMANALLFETPCGDAYNRASGEQRAALWLLFQWESEGMYDWTADAAKIAASERFCQDPMDSVAQSFRYSANYGCIETGKYC